MSKEVSHLEPKNLKKALHSFEVITHKIFIPEYKLSNWILTLHFLVAKLVGGSTEWFTKARSSKNNYAVFMAKHLYYTTKT